MEEIYSGDLRRRLFEAKVIDGLLIKISQLTSD